MKNRLFSVVEYIKNNDKVFSLVVAFSFQLVMTIIGFVIDLHTDGSVKLLSHIMKWDAGWYLAVIHDQYQNVPASPAFYPLFPLLVSIIHFISIEFIDYAFCGLIINTVSLYFIVLAFFKLSETFLPANKRYLPIILFLTFPSAFFLHVFYTEALFMALGMWAYVLAIKNRWLQMSLLLALLSASRLPAILYIALCLLEYLRSYKWSIKKALNPKIFYFFIAPLGFISYSIYLGIVRGDFLLMIHAYSLTTDWAYQIFDPNIFKTWAKVVHQIIRAVLGQRAFYGDIIVNHLLPLLSIIGVVLSSIILVKKDNTRSLAIVGFLSIILFSLNSNLVSVHRYVLTLPVIFIAIASIKNKYGKLTLILLSSIFLLMQIYLYYKFIKNIFAG